MTVSAGHAPTADLFKDAFRAHPAGIAVLTAQGPDGPVGLTASSVSSAWTASRSLGANWTLTTSRSLVG